MDWNAVKSKQRATLAAGVVYSALNFVVLNFNGDLPFAWIHHHVPPINLWNVQKSNRTTNAIYVIKYKQNDISIYIVSRHTLNHVLGSLEMQKKPHVLFCD
jgi:hypothetical protein